MVVSGNVSLYNETRGTSIFPTPVVGMVGLIDDVNYLADFKPQAGEKLYILIFLIGYRRSHHVYLQRYIIFLQLVV
jgi:phosphoribosylformylglycinamidine (FGAM) synthase-like enzyme